ncbi:Proprotein convertase P-domain-containing protein [Nitrosomonas marina]|uniref:Proprotein convertase P-domain-containing protein n=1 Tax=Nitrosomonas marina TaxID=917 RepID=A0A1I0F3I7_9PROT|nr:S8 family serine peptidase [Nitrosomonas marina]SET52613.1 Proprotein convertase P-domain-containing protein [Nitrosomonas marina]
MPKIYYGTKKEPAFELVQSDDLIAVRTRSKRSLTRSTGPVAQPISAELDDGVLVVSYPEAGVEVYRIPTDRHVKSVSDRKSALRASPEVQFAGSVLVDPVSKEPVLYTENIFIKFIDTADPDDCAEIIRDAGLTIKSQPDYATNAYFVEAPTGTGQKIFDIANDLLKHDNVEYCHPELIRPRARKQIFPQQWHLKKTSINGLLIDASVNVAAAHEITQGEGVSIAVIDDGVDIDHPEFSGTGKIVAPRDATLLTNNPRPKDTFGIGPNGDNHGTACAGVACANGIDGASGVAPKARLIPIRLASGLGSQREAEAFKWAADNGADVISCSWGPPDGRWWDKNDVKHRSIFQLPASTRLAMDYVTQKGRNGKGCVILFAAGNGNESVDNDGYASYSKVIAVTACNDRGTRSVYSDFGKAAWCAFPSSDFGYAPFQHPDALTPGIWTTDRIGRHGYNPDERGHAAGDPAFNYTNSFGGTSSACPGAAGIAALILSVNPDLKWLEVKTLFKKACDKIDPQNGDYNSEGHSPKYGYGRLNALNAVELAKPQPRNAVTINRRFDAPILDMQTGSFALEVADDTPIESLAISVDIQHTYIGDLILSLQPPAGTGIDTLVLYSRSGGATKNLKQTFDTVTTPELAKFSGKKCQGTWTLQIQDVAAQDSGTLVSFGINLIFPRTDWIVPAEKAKKHQASNKTVKKNFPKKSPNK